MQGQYDKIQAVKIRGLIGTGPRFQIAETDSAHLYLGALYMYEYEETSALEQIVYHRDSRLSTYLSGGFKPSSYLSFNHVTYFQPKLFNLKDFRISSETTMDVLLSSKLVWKTYFQFIYDEKPPFNIPRTMYILSNGISWRF